MVHDVEVLGGIEVLKKIADEAAGDLAPYVKKYNADAKYGAAISKALSQTLFPWHENKTASAYGTLVTLQGLHIYLANTQGHLLALTPSAQALWDKAFVAAVQQAEARMARCISWVQFQMTVRAPQTLIVPSKALWNGGKDEDDESIERKLYGDGNGDGADGEGGAVGKMGAKA